MLEAFETMHRQDGTTKGMRSEAKSETGARPINRRSQSSGSERHQIYGNAEIFREQRSLASTTGHRGIYDVVGLQGILNKEGER